MFGEMNKFYTPSTFIVSIYKLEMVKQRTYEYRIPLGVPLLIQVIMYA